MASFLRVESFGAEKTLFGIECPDLSTSQNLVPLLTARVSHADRRKVLGASILRILAQHGLAEVPERTGRQYSEGPV